MTDQWSDEQIARLLAVLREFEDRLLDRLAQREPFTVCGWQAESA